MDSKYENILKKLLEFREKRDWEQFHDPKNLAEAISIEAAELLEIFLWKDIPGSRNLPGKEINKIKEESADIFLFLLYLCEEYGIDILDEALNKIEVNEKRYPVEKAKGSAKKYKEL